MRRRTTVPKRCLPCRNNALCCASTDHGAYTAPNSSWGNLQGHCHTTIRDIRGICVDRLLLVISSLQLLVQPCINGMGQTVYELKDYFMERKSPFRRMLIMDDHDANPGRTKQEPSVGEPLHRTGNEGWQPRRRQRSHKPWKVGMAGPSRRQRIKHMETATRTTMACHGLDSHQRMSRCHGEKLPIGQKVRETAPVIRQ